MAGLVTVLVFGVGIGFFALIIGLVIWLVSMQSKGRRDAWQKVAQHHGLHYDGHAIRGLLHGQDVKVGTVTRGSGDSRRTYTVVRANLRTPLDLGLYLRRHGFFNDMFHRSADIAVGDPAFDDSFIVSADEPHRVQAMLDGRLRNLFQQHLTGSVSFSVNDGGMTVECRGATSDGAWLSWALELCARACALLDKGRGRTPPASALMPHRNAWQTYAKSHGLQGYDTPLCMWGSIEGTQVHAYAVRTDVARYQLEIALSFAEPLGLGLQLNPKGMLDTVAVFFGQQDHRLGDPWFDDTYRLQVARTDVIDEVLDASIRSELMAVHQNVGPIQLNDERLIVRLANFPQDPRVVPRTVHQLIGVTERLGARGVDRVGPYR